MEASLAVQVQESIAVVAEGATGLALDDGGGLAIVMIGAHGAAVGEFGPLGRGEFLDMFAI